MQQQQKNADEHDDDDDDELQMNSKPQTGRWICFDWHYNKAYYHCQQQQQQQQQETLEGDVLENVYYVCPTTDLFRKLATTLPDLTHEDPKNCRVVEIGCCTGKTTSKLLSQLTSPQHLLATDTSHQFIETCRQDPLLRQVQLERINVLLEWPRLVDMIVTKWPNLILYNDQKNQAGPRLKLIFFIDIGGNREIESLLAILQALLLPKGAATNPIQPHGVVVKSQTLYDHGIEHGLEDWRSLENLARSKVMQRRHGRTTTTDVEESEKEKEISSLRKETSQDSSTQPPPQQSRKRHPLKMPQRKTPNGKMFICRFHNYDAKNGCLLYKDTKKLGKHCPLDHNHCHSCLQVGHIALNCPTIQQYKEEENDDSYSSLMKVLL